MSAIQSSSKSSKRSTSSAGRDDVEELFPLTQCESDSDIMTEGDTGSPVLSPDDVKLTDKDTQSVTSQEIKCGFGKCKPDSLQIFNNPKCLLFFLCFFCMIQGFVVNGINNVNTTSVERRFELPSSRVGMISSAYDVSAAILGVLISHFCSGKYKARWLGIAAIIMSVGSFFMALPHFTTGRYEWGQNLGESCRRQPSEDDKCSESGSALQNYLYVFLFGQILHGVGGTSLYIVGVSLIDDSVPASSSPLYVGILYALATLGPALGYVVGGRMLDLYVDFHSVDSVDLTSEDPRWVGAWWIGFIAGSALSMTVAIPLLAYGSELPTAKSVRENRVSQTHTNVDDQSKKVEIGSSFRDIPHSLMLLLKNPAFVFITLAGTGEGFSTAGFATFLPKIIQNQFSTTAAWSSILSGLIAVPGAAGGQFVGGLVCKKLKLKVQGMIRLNLIVCAAAMVLDTVVWTRCDLNDIIGVNTHYGERHSLPDLTAACNSNCSCTTEYYEPVCHQGLDIQYFSPCHAGCSTKLQDNQGYGNCTCINSFKHGQNSSNTVTKGKCGKECNLLYLFLPFLLLAIFFRFIQSPPSLSVTLRCIHENQKTFALGIQWFIARLLGTVPGPILFGALIDSTCLVWQEKCGERASCWIYDNVALSRNFLIILIGFKVFTLIMFILAYKFYNPPLGETSMKIQYENDSVKIMESNSYVENSTETKNTR